MTNEKIVMLIKQGNGALMADLYENNKRFICDVIKHIGIQPENYEDAMHDAYFGLHEAVNGFDESKGYKFLTYAKHYIQRAIQRGQCDTLHIPDYIRITARKIKRIQIQLTQQLNRTPTASELSCFTAIDTETIKYILNTVKPLKSIYEPIADDLFLGDTIADTSIDFENDIADSDERIYIHETLKAIIYTLPEAERTAIQLHYLQGLTYKEIGQIIGISIERVRQLINKGLQILRHKKDIYALFEDEIDSRTSFYRHKGLNAFNITWTSSTEQTVIDREYMRQGYMI